MYCPNCGCEYREGFTICTDCGENLIGKKPKIEKTSFLAGLINHISPKIKRLNEVEKLENQIIEGTETKGDYEKIHKNGIGIYTLAVAHLVITVNYLYQLYRFTKGNISPYDPITRDVALDVITYVSIIISLVLITFNLVCSLGLIKGKSWGWWLSGSYFISLIPQSIMSIIFYIKLGFEIQGSTDSHYEFPFIDKIYSSLYLSIIALLVVVFLYHNHIYYKFHSNRFSKKASVFILLGVGVSIIILRYLLGVLGSIL